MHTTAAKTAHTLNDLVEITRDGREFYDWARQQDVGPGLQSIFADLERAKASLVSQLSNLVTVRGEKVAEHGTLVGSLRKLYTELRTSMTSDKPKVVVAQLEESEDRLLEAFQEARDDARENPELAAILDRYLPRVRASHEQMRQLKHSMQ